MCEVNEKYVNCLLGCLGYPQNGLEFQGSGKKQRLGISLRGHDKGRRGERLLGHLLAIAKAQSILPVGEALTSAKISELIPLHKNSVYGVLEILTKMQWLKRKCVPGFERKYNYFITKSGIKKLNDKFGEEASNLKLVDDT